MKKRFTLIFLVFILLNSYLLTNVLAENIDPLSELSPIKETFDKKIIVWRFDDIRIANGVFNNPTLNKYISMTENVTKYGGYVGWGFIPGSLPGNWAPPAQNLTYPQERIEVLKTVTSDEQISLWLHCWNHSWYAEGYGPSVWTKSLEEQRKALNHTIWTFENNFGYYPPVFSAGGSRGNVNTSIVLAERDILLLYGGSGYEPPDVRLRYLSLPSCKDSVIFGLDYYNRENILEDMKAEFTKRYQNNRILQVTLHPSGWNENTISLFAEFTQWVYTTHNLINMNFTNAYNYKHDLASIQLFQQNDNTYQLWLKDAINPLEITWNKEGYWVVKYAHNHTRYGELDATSHSDSIILNPGYEYIIQIASDTKTDRKNQIPFTNNVFMFLIIGMLLYSLFKSTNKRK